MVHSDVTSQFLDDDNVISNEIKIMKCQLGTFSDVTTRVIIHCVIIGNFVSNDEDFFILNFYTELLTAIATHSLQGITKSMKEFLIEQNTNVPSWLLYMWAHLASIIRPYNVSNVISNKCIWIWIWIKLPRINGKYALLLTLGIGEYTYIYIYIYIYIYDIYDITLQLNITGISYG